MRVDAGPGANQHYSRENMTRPPLTEKKIAKAESARIEENTAVEKSDETSEKGVIRKLQDGHFKGVADVRLRTIFHAELQATQKENDLAQLRQTASQITETISSEFDSLVGLAELEGETLQAANQLFAEFENDVASVTTNASDLQKDIVDLRSAVDTLLSSFKGLVDPEPAATDPEQLNSSTSEQAEIIQGEILEERQTIIETAESKLELEVRDNETVNLEPGDVTNADASDEDDPVVQAFDDLAIEIEGLFADLQSSLLESNNYEPVPPNGNGVAFEKFLAIYRQINESADQVRNESANTADNLLANR